MKVETTKSNLHFRFRYLFICQGTLTRRQKRPFRSSSQIFWQTYFPFSCCNLWIS